MKKMTNNEIKNNQIKKPLNLLEYRRVSTYKQKKDVTIETQRVVNGKFKEIHKDLYNIINVYEDDGKSGFKFGKEDRPDFHKLLEDLYSIENADGILVYDIDRIGRDALELMELGDDFVKKNKVIVSVNKGGIIEQDSPEGKFIYGIFALMSELKGTTDKRRMHEGRERKKQKNIEEGRPAYFGFGRKKKIVPKNIKDKMIKWYKKEYGFKEIQNRMQKVPYLQYNEKDKKYKEITGFKLSTSTIGVKLKEWGLLIREPKYSKSKKAIQKQIDDEVDKRMQKVKEDIMRKLQK